MNKQTQIHKYDMDVIVVGGGSEGVAFAKEAKIINPKLKIAIFNCTDNVSRSKSKSKSSKLSQTYITKKIMSHVGHTIKSINDSNEYGFNTSYTFSWEKMRESIKKYVTSLNEAHIDQLIKCGIEYVDSRVEFVDDHTITFEDSISHQQKQLTSKYFVLAINTNPNYGNYYDVEHYITLDDLFLIDEHPGEKILIVGGGHLAIECANILNELGIQVDVMFRSSILKKIDEQCSEQIAELMERNGVKFIQDEPTEFKKLDEKICITTKNGINSIYDNVIIAIGRKANITGFGLENLGIKTNDDKIIVDTENMTSIKNIFALGDVTTHVTNNVYCIPMETYGRLINPDIRDNSFIIKIDNDNKFYSVTFKDLVFQNINKSYLESVSIKFGVILAKQLFNNEYNTYIDNDILDWAPNSILTMPEYAYAGITEKQAYEKYGEQNIDVWYSRYTPIENYIHHSKFKSTRSNLFTGRNLWARRFAEQNKVYWKNICYDIGSSVLWNTNIYTIINIDKNDLTYTITDRTDSNDTHIVDMCELSPIGSTEELEYQQHTIANHLCKLITDSFTGEVLGIHFIGDRAEDIIQGFVTACIKGITKAELDMIIPIHFVAANEFLSLSINKKSKQCFMKNTI